MKALGLILAASAVLALLSCERDPIIDQESNYTVSLNVTDNWKKDIKVESRLWWYDPSFMQIGWSKVLQILNTGYEIKSAYGENFLVKEKELFTMQLEQFKMYVYYDNGSKVFAQPMLYNIRQTYLQPDPGKYYLFGITPGEYNFIAVSDFTSSTYVTYAEKLSLITAETEVISSTSQVVINSPAPIYVGRKLNYTVPYVKKGDGYHNIPIYLESPVESWRLIIHSIKNLCYASTISFILTNQYKEVYLGDLHPSGIAAIAFSGTCSEDLLDINTVFGTFGMIEGEKYILQATIVDYAGFTHKQSFDVTRQVEAQRRSDRTIEFDWDLVLETLVQGGLKPNTQEWEEDTEHQTIT